MSAMSAMSENCPPALRIVLYYVAQDYLEECGCCGGYHPTGYAGDCRDDNKRFSHPDDLAEQWIHVFENPKCIGHRR